MNDKTLLTKDGKKFITYKKADKSKIEAAINGGFREATAKEEAAYLEKVGLVPQSEPAKEVTKPKPDNKPVKED